MDFWITTNFDVSSSSKNSISPSVCIFEYELSTPTGYRRIDYLPPKDLLITKMDAKTHTPQSPPQTKRHHEWYKVRPNRHTHQCLKHLTDLNLGIPRSPQQIRPLSQNERHRSHRPRIPSTPRPGPQLLLQFARPRQLQILRCGHEDGSRAFGRVSTLTPFVPDLGVGR